MADFYTKILTVHVLIWNDVYFERPFSLMPAKSIHPVKNRSNEENRYYERPISCWSVVKFEYRLLLVTSIFASKTVHFRLKIRSS